MLTSALDRVHLRALIGLGATVALLIGLLASGPASADASKPSRGPRGAAFYTPPEKFPSAHGRLIWHRKAGNLTPIEGAASDQLVLYTSKTPRGRTVAVSGSVSVPKGKAPKGGWPVISYAHGTTGTADSCAPTRVTAQSPVAPYVTYLEPELEAWVDAGYAVVRTDYQGLGTPGDHQYLIGSAEGRSVLDMVSAARKLDPDIGKRYLIAGHSQGGQSALFAAGEARDYSPQLKLRGTVAYAPASHILAQAKALPSLTTPSPLSALAALIVKGASTATNTVNIPQLLSDEALALYPQVDQTCLQQLGQSDSFGGMAPSDLLRDGADTGPLYGVLDAENPNVKTKAPILLAQGSADSTVFKVFTDQLNDELTASGDDVNYKVFDGISHGEIPAAAEAAVMKFFKKRLPPKG